MLGSGHKVSDTRGRRGFWDISWPPRPFRDPQIPSDAPYPSIYDHSLTSKTVLKCSDLHKNWHLEVKLCAEFKNRRLDISTYPHYPQLPIISRFWPHFSLLQSQLSPVLSVFHLIWLLFCPGTMDSIQEPPIQNLAVLPLRYSDWRMIDLLVYIF